MNKGAFLVKRCVNNVTLRSLLKLRSTCENVRTFFICKLQDETQEYQKKELIYICILGKSIIMLIR